MFHTVSYNAFKRRYIYNIKYNLLRCHTQFAFQEEDFPLKDVYVGSCYHGELYYFHRKKCFLFL